MAALYRKAMDYLYLVCVVVGCIALVLISAIIPWAVFTRYVLNSASSWPEPVAVLLTIALTFFGAAACYRYGLHMNIALAVNLLPKPLQKLCGLATELIMALISLFMAVWGARLVAATWYNSIGDFPGLSVGITYLPIPIGGAIMLLFVLERLLIGQPHDTTGDAHGVAAFD
jgi:TRAP-type C4-dicarboxylate transport system permease small subunit